MLKRLQLGVDLGDGASDNLIWFVGGDDRHDRFTAWTLDPDGAKVPKARIPVGDEFNVLGKDLQAAAAHDRELASSLNAQPTVVQATDVTGPEPPIVGERLAGGVWVVPIRAEDAGAPGLDLIVVANA